MQKFLTLARRELAAYFVSMTGYIVVAAVVFLLGLSFVHLVEALQGDATPAPLTELFYQTYYFWIIILITTPILTMRLFAQEKFSGTFENLMTTPVSDAQVVGAKFTAALLFHLLMWLPLLGFIYALHRFVNDPTASDPGAVASTFLGITLIGALFISVGCFGSALTRSQITAAMISFVLGTGLFFTSFMLEMLPPAAARWGTSLSYLSLFEHMRDFARGVVDTRAVTLYVTLSGLFLFLTLRVVGSRRWK